MGTHMGPDALSPCRSMAHWYPLATTLSFSASGFAASSPRQSAVALVRVQVTATSTVSFSKFEAVASTDRHCNCSLAPRCPPRPEVRRDSSLIAHPRCNLRHWHLVSSLLHSFEWRQPAHPRLSLSKSEALAPRQSGRTRFVGARSAEDSPLFSGAGQTNALLTLCQWSMIVLSCSVQPEAHSLDSPPGP